MKCPVCKNTHLRFIYRFSDIPAINHAFLLSRKKAIYGGKPVINLYGCENCNFVFNADFSLGKSEYDASYDNRQEFSPHVQEYLRGLAARLVDKYKLESKTVVEVGCGKGYFLNLLYELGVRHLQGFDPAYVDSGSVIDHLVKKEYFSGGDLKEKVDFIILRHTLEHIPEPRPIAASLITGLKNEGTIFFEVPDLNWIIENEAFFDFTYEHCNYFTPRSLCYLLGEAGFGQVNLSYGFDGQYLQGEFSRGFLRLKTPLIDFNKIPLFINRKMTQYKSLLENAGNFIIWGAGGKGVVFLNRLRIDFRKCPYVIDINPNKQGKFIPFTGQEVVSPEILNKKKVDTIVVMNPVYEQEIKKTALDYNYKGKFVLV